MQPNQRAHSSAKWQRQYLRRSQAVQRNLAAQAPGPAEASCTVEEHRGKKKDAQEVARLRKQAWACALSNEKQAALNLV